MRAEKICTLNFCDGKCYWFYVAQPWTIFEILYKLDKVISLVCCYFFFKMLKCIELDERLKAMDQEITVNPQFVQKVTDLVFCKS